MATLFVTPVRRIVVQNGLVIPIYFDEPDGSGFEQTIKADYSGGAAKTASRIPDGAPFVELLCDTNCYYVLQDQSASAAASTSDRPLTANLARIVALPPNVPASGWGYSAISRT